MKIVKILLGVLVAIIVAAGILSAIAPNEMVYEKTITVNKPIGEVWPHTGSLVAMDKWSPWNDKDPDMTKTIEGTPGTVGEKSSWDSDNENVGAGSQEITVVQAPTTLETKLLFTKPWESEAMGYVYLKEAEGGTDVTWGFKSEIGFPMDIISMLFMDMEAQMGADWDLGLGRLKSIAETGKIVL